MAKRSAKKVETAEVAQRLDQAADAFDAENYQTALLHADAVLEKDPEHPEALHFRAAAQVELGEVEDAAESYLRAVKASPDNPEVLLGAAECLIVGLGEDRDAVGEGLELCARGRKLAERADDVELVFEFLLLEATGLNQVGECEAALASAQKALAHVPRSVEAQLEQALALFELCRFEEARKAFERVLEDEPDEPWAHHSLGLLAERRKDSKEAERRFARAQVLAPEEFPPPVDLSEADFDKALEDAVKGLPEHVKGYLDNVTIAVEDLPSDEDLLAEKPPLSPAILGVFRGTPVGERSVMNAADHFPAAIVLYQKNLERFARTREELIEQIGITVMHEVGHLIGLDEEDLWERGLD